MGEKDYKTSYQARLTQKYTSLCAKLGESVSRDVELLDEDQLRMAVRDLKRELKESKKPFWLK